MKNGTAIRIQEIVKVYAVMHIKSTTMEEMFRSTEKDACKEFKKQNKSVGKLAVIWVDNMCVSI